MLGYGGDRTAAKELAEQHRKLKSDLEHKRGALAAEKERQAIAEGMLGGVQVAPEVANQIRVLETQLHAVGETLARARGRLDEILAEDSPTA